MVILVNRKEFCSEVFYRPVSLWLPYFFIVVCFFFISLPVNILATLSKWTLIVAQLRTVFYKKAFWYFSVMRIERSPQATSVAAFISILKAFFLSVFCYSLSDNSQAGTVLSPPSSHSVGCLASLVLIMMCFTARVEGLVGRNRFVSWYR